MAKRKKWGTTREVVLQMTLAGHKPREIATQLGLSTQAIYGHLDNLIDAGELPPRGQKEQVR